MQLDLAGAPPLARWARACERCLLRLLAGFAAIAALFVVSSAHTFVRGLAYHHHLFPAVSPGSIESIFGLHGTTVLQAIVPVGDGQHPALVVWTSLFWLSPLLMFTVALTLGPRQCLRLLLLHTTVLVISDVIFFIVPTMPPWMADGTPRLLASSVGDVLRVDTNPTAALPSLHVAVPCIAAIWLWNHEHFVVRALGRLWMLRAALMFWAVVYTGEHFVLDGAAGIAIAFGVYHAYDAIGLAQIRSMPVRAQRALHLPEAHGASEAELATA